MSESLPLLQVSMGGCRAVTAIAAMGPMVIMSDRTLSAGTLSWRFTLLGRQRKCFISAVAVGANDAEDEEGKPLSLDQQPHNHTWCIASNTGYNMACKRVHLLQKDVISVHASLHTFSGGKLRICINGQEVLSSKLPTGVRLRLALTLWGGAVVELVPDATTDTTPTTLVEPLVPAASPRDQETAVPALTTFAIEQESAMLRHDAPATSSREASHDDSLPAAMFTQFDTDNDGWLTLQQTIAALQEGGFGGFAVSEVEAGIEDSGCEFGKFRALWTHLKGLSTRDTEPVRTCRAFVLRSFLSPNDHRLTFLRGEQEILDDPELPQGWVQDVSQSTGQVYYVDTSTGFSTYDRPVPHDQADVSEENTLRTRFAQFATGDVLGPAALGQFGTRVSGSLACALHATVIVLSTARVCVHG